MTKKLLKKLIISTDSEWCQKRYEENKIIQDPTSEIHLTTQCFVDNLRFFFWFRRYVLLILYQLKYSNSFFWLN